MAVKILQKENKILRATAKEVAVKDIKGKEIKNLIKKMEIALLENKEGVAIAAPQVGESLRIFIIAKRIFGQEIPIPNFVFINPIIKKISKKKNPMNEGCLSVANYYGNVKRAERLTVEAVDQNGKKFSFSFSGILAQIVQHEIDHLNGVLFIDKVEDLQKLT